MNCYIHGQKEAIGTCVACGKFICADCNTEIKGKNYCKHCVEELFDEKNKKIEKLEDSSDKGTTVFMNAGGGASSSSSAAATGGGYAPVCTKNKIVAGILALFLGGIGAHKFYLGRIGQGILYLLFCWTGIPAVLGLIEGIIYLISSDENFAMKYGRYVRM